MKPTKQALAAQMLHVASGYVGVSRENNRGQVSNFLALYGLPFAEDGTPLAFCASGTGYSGVHAYCDLSQIPYTPDSVVSVFRSVKAEFCDNYFLINPSCTTMVDDAKQRGTWLDVDAIGDDVTLLPGWLVFYQFGETDRHVELLTADDGDHIETIGFNTECAGHSGVVAVKRRDWGCIWGYIKTW